MRFLRTNTATRVTVGPFLDPSDGVTPETGLTVTNCHLTLTVDDSGVPTLVLDADATASGGNNDMAHVSGDDAGFYDLELTAAQLNYLGRAMLAITDATNHCPVFHEFMIIPGNVYDALILGTDALQVDTIQVGGTSQTGDDLGAGVTAIETDTQDIQGRLPAALVSGRMASDVEAINDDATAADNLGASALGIVTGQAQTGTLSTTQMTTDLSETTTDHYKGRVVVWITGVLLGQAATVSAYDGSGMLTYSQVTDAPSNGDNFVIV